MIESIDIIVPLYKPGESFLKQLSMLGRQSVPFSRLIIINTLDGDEETAAEEAEKLIYDHADAGRIVLRHIKKEEFDHAGTRRLAVGLSDADAFLCMTDDAVPFDEFLLERLINALNSDSKTAIAYARQIPRDDADEAERYSREFNYPDKSLIKSIKDIGRLGIKTYFASNACAAYRRSVYDETGGFVDFAVFNEDMLYAAKALRAGFLIYYNAEAKVIHSHNYGPVKQFRRNFDNGMSQAMHPEVFGNVSSESEGIRYVKNTVTHLRRSGHTADIPGFIVNSGCKFIGFRLGKMYDRIPVSMVRRLSADGDLAARALEGAAGRPDPDETKDA